MADIYICKRIADGREKETCNEFSDCPHARPHEKKIVTNFQYCDTYGTEGPCDVCIIKPDDWDK